MGIRPSSHQNRRPKVKKSESTRNPFGKLKELFRPRSKKISSTPTSDATSDSIEMRSFDKYSGTASMSNSERSLKDLTRREERAPGAQSQTREGQAPPQGATVAVAVPKIVLSTYDEKEEDQGLLKQRKNRSKRPKKVRQQSGHPCLCYQNVPNPKILSLHHWELLTIP